MDKTLFVFLQKIDKNDLKTYGSSFIETGVNYKLFHSILDTIILKVPNNKKILENRMK